ncbi:MAG: hypothetical protein HY661_02385 [Betaproteobacteria bacterium]|nr:hypothetical protein [Betaproteobacteria bacterium]
MALRIGIYILAAVVLAAHFLRQGNIAPVVLCLCAPLLFLHRKRWTLIGLQLLAYGAAASWVVLALRLIQLRQQSGQSWTLAATILGAVALVTLLAGLLLNSRAIRERYPL